MSDPIYIPVPSECKRCIWCKNHDQMFAKSIQYPNEQENRVPIRIGCWIRIGCKCSSNNTTWKTAFFPDKESIREWNLMNATVMAAPPMSDLAWLKKCFDKIGISHEELNEGNIIHLVPKLCENDEVFNFDVSYEFDKHGKLTGYPYNTLTKGE